MHTTAPPLTATDRCDRCGAQAKLRAVLIAGELLFCKHHAERYHEALVQKAMTSL